MKQIRFLRLFLSHFFARYMHRSGYRTKERFGFLPFPPKYLFALPLVVLFLFLLIAFNPGISIKSEVSQGIVGVYTKDNIPSIVANLISKPLVKIDKNGRPQPELVSGWQANNNATLYTFKLRDGLFWSDGTKVKSSDIKFNLADVEVSYPDEGTIQFKLADSFDPFPSLLTSPVFKGDTLVGVGGFKVLGRELNHNIITKLVLDSKEGNLPRVTVRFYPDEGTAKTAFELGEVESLIGFTETNEVKNQPSVSSKGITNYNRLVAIFYNTKDPILTDKNMRKALTAASPKIEGEDLAKTSIAPTSWAYNEDLRELLGDLELAKGYLDKVGNGKSSTITLTATPALSGIGEMVIRSWKQAGINAVLRVESGVPQNFQALLLSEPIPRDPDQYALWHSTQSRTNVSKFSSPRADKDLEDGRKTSDVEKRYERYLDLQKVLLDESPATFLYFPKTQIVFRRKTESDLNKILSLQFPKS